MKKVVYLLGGGATQAELDDISFGANVSMESITREVYDKSEADNGPYFRLLQRLSVSGRELDIEHMITLFQRTEYEHSPNFERISFELKKRFKESILSQLDIFKRGSDLKPKLAISLLQLHKKYKTQLDEELLAILTTNYDNLLDTAMKEVYQGVDYGVLFNSKDYPLNDEIPELLKLHGSFNWRIKNDELQVENSFETDSNDQFSGWLPPSLYKNPKEIIYRSVWSRARSALMDCDVLRIVGSSLREEDWAMLSLIFRSQSSGKHQKQPFEIELICREVDADPIIKRIKFFGKFKSLSPSDPNPFRYWLQTKIDTVPDANTDVIISSMLPKGG